VGEIRGKSVDHSAIVMEICKLGACVRGFGGAVRLNHGDMAAVLVFGRRKHTHLTSCTSTLA
jgi:hypothetical protein